jgi:hypothetical protein
VSKTLSWMQDRRQSVCWGGGLVCQDVLDSDSDGKGGINLSGGCMFCEQHKVHVPAM